LEEPGQGVLTKLKKSRIMKSLEENGLKALY
jgi:hypothetical protein